MGEAFRQRRADAASDDEKFMPLTRDLATACAALRYEDIPPAALPFIRTGFTDSFGTMVAGRDSEPSRILRGALGETVGPCRLMVDRGTARALDAAWLNATAAHALDFDDAAQKGHLSTVLVPAILALAESGEAGTVDGRAMATAYAVGYEAWAELIRRESDLYHNHSWHPTGVFGPLSAAAACASLLRLNAEQTVFALAMAASQSGGLIANFGSMTKPCHAGWAAHAGMMSARLAARGMGASPDALEHPKGLMKGISPHGNVDLDAPVMIGREWRLPVDGLNIKKYPNCFASHRALDAMLGLLEEHDIPVQVIAKVAARTSRRNRATLRFEYPVDALQAKFSMQFAMAAALLTRRCSLQELDDAFVRREDVRALMRCVEVFPLDEPDATRAGEAPEDGVTIETTDGRRFVRNVAYARGGPELPLLPGELFAKFESCLVAGGLPVAPRPLFDALMAVDELPGTAALYAFATH